MEIYTYEWVRPSVLPAARAQRVLAGVCLPQAHQVQAPAPAELILAAAPTGVEGTSGFTGNGIQGAEKRMDVRGVPPRGRRV